MPTRIFAIRGPLSQLRCRRRRGEPAGRRTWAILWHHPFLRRLPETPMGRFCVNMHFRSTDDKALTAAVKKRGVTASRVLPAKGGWTTLYEEEASHQDDRRIRELTGGLSRDLKVAAIAFMVHDSDIACYWLYEDGQLLDEYNSCPEIGRAHV